MSGSVVMEIGSSVRSIMIARARSGSKRGSRSDGHHLSLVIESGGMRGVAAGGFIKVLADAALTDTFDSIHGSSAGACAAAYFLAGQANLGLKIYEDIATREVVNPLRFLSQPCIVDTDYIADVLMAKKWKLDAQPIISEPGVLNVTTTSATDGLPVIHNRFRTAEELLLALKASLRVPGPLEPGVLIEGRRHLDGALIAPMPLFSAAAAGATHILAVCTQRVQDYTESSRVIAILEGAAVGAMYGRALMNRYIAAHGADRRILGSGVVIPTDFLIRPASATHCGRLTIDVSILAKVEAESAEAARAYLRGDTA